MRHSEIMVKKVMAIWRQHVSENGGVVNANMIWKWGEYLRERMSELGKGVIIDPGATLEVTEASVGIR
jgi:hypothetical protein